MHDLPPTPIAYVPFTPPASRRRVGVLGASGTTGVELVSLLASHPAIELVYASSREHAGAPLTVVDPSAPPVPLVHPSQAAVEDVEVVLTALPHGAAGAIVETLLGFGRRVVDLSGDHRLTDAAVHDEVYGSSRHHGAAASAVYGLTELARRDVASAQLVANPGCYPTCVGLALAPLASAGLLGDNIFIDAKSGVSGAGRKATASTHFCAVADDVRPYKLGREHRHAPEIDQLLRRADGRERPGVVFCPHVLPLERGMLATTFLADAPDAEAVYRELDEAYVGEPFVEVLPFGEPARIRAVARTPRAQIGVHDAGRCTVVTSAIDNLMKGAASQAIQNLNLMLGLDERLGMVPAVPDVRALEAA